MPDLAGAALVRKHAELSGEIEALQIKLDGMRADLVHLHAAIRILSPGVDPAAIRPKRPSRRGCEWFGRSELGRLMLEVLRDAREPLSAVAVAREVMERRGLDPSDRTALRRVEGMVGPALRRREGKTVESIVNGRRALTWRLAAA